MKKLIVVFFITLLSFTVSTSIETKALMINELPTSEKSKQWLVEVTKPDTDDTKLMKPKKGLYHTYGLNIKNIGKDVENVKVQAFQNEPHSTTQYGLFGTIEPSELSKKGGRGFRFSNFGLAEKAKDLNIIVTWKEQGNEREYQETFTFHQK